MPFITTILQSPLTPILLLSVLYDERTKYKHNGGHLPHKKITNRMEMDSLAFSFLLLIFFVNAIHRLHSHTFLLCHEREENQLAPYRQDQTRQTTNQNQPH